MKKQTVVLLAFSAMAYRLILLFVQRSLGIEWDFHPDAGYYVAGVGAIERIGLESAFYLSEAENMLYIFVGYFLRNVTFSIIDLPDLYIAFNLAMAFVTVLTLGRLAEEFRIVGFAVVFYAFSPYLAHISIHPLKDALVILLTISLVRFASLRSDRSSRPRCPQCSSLPVAFISAWFSLRSSEYGSSCGTSSAHATRGS